MPSIKDLTFSRAFGRGGLLALVAAIACIAGTGGCIAFGFTVGGGVDINPQEIYFGSNNLKWLKWIVPPGMPDIANSGMCGANPDRTAAAVAQIQY